MKIKEEIRIVSIDKRYRKEPYPVLPIYSEQIGTYLTGQHIDPNNPETKGNLTIKEMLGEDQISAEKKARFPYIIVPEVYVPLVHLRRFDLSKDNAGDYVNPKDVAEFELFKIQDIVAPNKHSVQTNKHYFYIENKEQEAKLNVSRRQLRYRAESLVMNNMSDNTYKEIALLLNYKIQDFKANVAYMSETLIQEAILNACESNPEQVIQCFSDEAKDDLFIIKAEYHGCIERRGNSFFDGQQYLGDTIDEIKKFIRTEEGKRYMNRWHNQISNAEHKEAVNKPDNFDELVKDTLSALTIDEDLVKAQKLYDQAFIERPGAEQLIKLKQLIDEKSKPKVTREQLLEKYNKKELPALKMVASHKKIEKDLYKDLDKEQLINLLIETELKL